MRKLVDAYHLLAVYSAKTLTNCTVSSALPTSHHNITNKVLGMMYNTK